MNILKKVILFLKNKPLLRDTILYLPIFLLVCFFVFHEIEKHKENIRQLEQAQVLSFQKYEGNLKKHLSIPLQEAGLSKEKSFQIVNKLDTVLQMNRLAPRDTYLLTLDNDGKFKMIVVTKDFSRYYVAEGPEGLVAGILDISTESRERFEKGTVDYTLFNSMQEKGLKPTFVLDFTDIFSWAIDFNTETRKGDKYALLWEEEYTKDGETLNERILAAYYDGGLSGKNYAIRFEDEFYDENGKFTKKMFLKSPISVRGARISSRFNKARLHPILRIRRPHLGIDYAAPSGTPIESVADGVVRSKGWKGGFGNYMEVHHPNNYVTCYGHLKGYARGIANGTKVKQGQTIAYVGSTGLSTGPHLDFRIRQNGKYFDFLKTKNRSSASKEIPASKKEEFNKIRDEYLKRLESEAN